MRRLVVFALALAFGLLALTPVLIAENPNTAKRLILKDGTYQPATKWEVNGDRVRYYSSERAEWEEVPNSLVDWPATEKWNKERESAEISAETKKISAELEADRKAEEAQTPTVAPGVRLPSNGGVFLLDKFEARQEIAELVQNGGQVNKQTGRNILRAAVNPIASAKQAIELEGAHARVQSHELRPVIYVDVDSDNDPSTGPTPADAAHRFRIVHLQVKNNVRVVGNVKIALTGKVSQQQTFVDAVAAPFSGEWVKVQPTADLPPGEYALAEMLGEKEMNLYVWDFGVNPHAPENPTAWKPTQPAQSKTGTDESPVLNKRE